MNRNWTIGIIAGSIAALSLGVGALAAPLLHITAGGGHAAVNSNTQNHVVTQAQLNSAQDPSLPPVVATVNGTSISAKAVAQQEVILNSQPAWSNLSKHGLESAALDRVIQTVVLQQAAKQRGLDPSFQKATSQLKSEGVTNPSKLQIEQWQEMMGMAILLKSVQRTAPPGQGHAAMAALAQGLIKHAKITRVPRF